MRQGLRWRHVRPAALAYQFTILDRALRPYPCRGRRKRRPYGLMQRGVPVLDWQAEG